MLSVIDLTKEIIITKFFCFQIEYNPLNSLKNYCLLCVESTDDITFQPTIIGSLYEKVHILSTRRLEISLKFIRETLCSFIVGYSTIELHHLHSICKF